MRTLSILITIQGRSLLENGLSNEMIIMYQMEKHKSMRHDNYYNTSAN